MSRFSLKAHILLGAILWTVGLFTVAGIFHDFIHYSVLATSHHSFSVLGHVPLPAMATVAVVCMLFGLLQVRRGIASINRLRNRLTAVHKGVENQVLGSYPAEVQPLVDDLNALLSERDRRVSRALAKAGDLAHGLKTPLAVLSYDAEQVRGMGHDELAADIDKQIDRMQRQLDYHLAHAQAASSAASRTARTPIAVCVDGLVRTLQRLHSDQGLRIDFDIHTSHVFRGQTEDLDEMLGNLLDNACKWAKTRVMVACSKEHEQIVITVDDDGPGIDPAIRTAVIQRGVRADETAEGFGLGLAIVRDLAEIYGGSIALEDSPVGGTRAKLTLPA